MTSTTMAIIWTVFGSTWIVIFVRRLVIHIHESDEWPSWTAEYLLWICLSAHVVSFYCFEHKVEERLQTIEQRVGAE